MNFVCIVFEIGDKMLTLSSMENLIVQCNLWATCLKMAARMPIYGQNLLKSYSLEPEVP